MKQLTQQQLVLLADRLIDDAYKKDPKNYPKDRFTGGAVLTAFHYGKISYKADLYFGYGKSKNPIHCKVNISEDIAVHVFDAINEKCKRSIEEDTYSSDLLNDIVTTSLRSRTTPYKDKKRKEEDKKVGKLSKTHHDYMIEIYVSLDAKELQEILPFFKKCQDVEKFGALAKKIYEETEVKFRGRPLWLCRKVSDEMQELSKPEKQKRRYWDMEGNEVFR